MDFELSEEQRAFAQSARDFAQAEFAPHAAQWDAEAVFPKEAIAKAGELGFCGLYAPERIGGQREGRDAARAAAARAGHQHQHVGRARAGDEGLAAVDHVLGALQFRARLECTSVRARAGLGEAIGRQQFATRQAPAVALADLRCPPGAEHPGRHVVDADECGGRRIDRGHFLEHQRRVQTRQRQAADAFGRVQAAEAQGTGLLDRLLGKDALAVPLGRMRRELALREFTRRVGKGALFFG